MNATLYTTHDLDLPSASLIPGAPGHAPFASVRLNRRGAEITSHDPAELDALAAEFTSAAAMLREALAAGPQPEAPRG